MSCTWRLSLRQPEVLGSDMFLKVAEKAKREREERLQKETEIKRLKEEYAEMIERKQEVERQVQTHTVYWDFMEPVVKITKFEDVQVPMGHLKSCLHLRDQFCQSESEVQENQKRKALLTLKDQHHLLRLHKNNQLSQLQTGLEKSRSEALIWVPDIIPSQSPTSELRPDQMLLKDSTTILCENQLPLSSYRKTKKESTPTGTDYDGDPCCFKTEFTVNSLN